MLEILIDEASKVYKNKICYRTIKRDKYEQMKRYHYG